jgi:Cys-rich protein (TIGR01571 family)
MGQALQGQTSDFHTDPFDCMSDSPSFLEACFLPCCTIAYISGAMRRPTQHRRVGFDCPQCCISAMLTPFCFMGVAIFSCQLNRRIKHRYNIPRQPDECIYETFCWGANLSRIVREMGLRGEHPGGVCSKPPARTIGGGAMGGANNNNNHSAGLLQLSTLQRPQRQQPTAGVVVVGGQPMMMMHHHHHHHHHHQQQQVQYAQPQMMGMNYQQHHHQHQQQQYQYQQQPPQQQSFQM